MTQKEIDFDTLPGGDFAVEKCPFCGGNTVLATEKDFDYAGVVLHDIQLYKCEKCAEGVFNPAQLKALDQKTVEAKREAQGLLTAEEIQAIIQELDIPQARVEKILGINPHSFNRWSKSKSIQSDLADSLLRILRKHPQLIVELASEKGIKLRGKIPGRPKKQKAL
jgi:HTH-type transcriptional regulator / antitoxin MqsA